MATLDFAVQKITDKSFIGAIVFTMVIAFSGAGSITRAEEAKSPSLFDLDIEWVDQNEKPFEWKAIDKKMTVMSMVYTSCQSVCSLITQKMQAIERKIPEDDLKNFRFLLVSIDPERDTPAVMLNFAKTHKLELKRWTLLTPKEGGERLIAAALDFRFKKLADGEFAHSNQITLLDPRGRILLQESDLKKLPQSLLDTIEKNK